MSIIMIFKIQGSAIPSRSVNKGTIKINREPILCTAFLFGDASEKDLQIDFCDPWATHAMLIWSTFIVP